MIDKTEVAQIRDLILDQAEAIRNKDIQGASKNYATDALLFDVVGLLQQKGAISVGKRLAEWFASFNENESVEFEIVNLTIKADDEIGFSFGFNHITAPLKNGEKLDMYWRETLCWQKKDNAWQIVNAHSSVPFNSESGKAETGLKP